MYANAQNSIIWLKSCEPPGPPSPPFSHCLAVSRAKVPLDPQSTFRRKRWHKPLTPSTGDPAAMEDWCWKWLESGGRSRLLVVGWNGAGWSRTIAVMNRNSVIVGAVHCNHEVGFLFFTIEWPCWSMHHSNLPSTPWKWCARTMFMPKHSVMLWSISTPRPLCHVDSMNTQLDSLNNGHTHPSGLVITRTYHGSNTNLWATWQPTKVVNPWEVPSKWMLRPLSRGDGEMSMLAVKQQNYAASKNGFE